MVILHSYVKLPEGNPLEFNTHIAGSVSHLMHKRGPERGGWDELVVKIAILMDMVGEEGWLVENLGCLFP